VMAMRTRPSSAKTIVLGDAMTLRCGYFS